jgi:hypothetical protein
VMLCLCDVEESSKPLEEIMVLCVESEFALHVCWKPEEVAAYLTSFRRNLNKGADSLKAKKETQAFAAAAAALTQIRSINKTDAATLLSTFGSFRQLAELSGDDLAACPGFGEKKASRLLATLSAPFPSSTPSHSHSHFLPSPSTPSSLAVSSSSPTAPMVDAPLLRTVADETGAEVVVPVSAKLARAGQHAMQAALRNSINLDDSPEDELAVPILQAPASIVEGRSVNSDAVAVPPPDIMTTEAILPPSRTHPSSPNGVCSLSRAEDVAHFSFYDVQDDDM